MTKLRAVALVATLKPSPAKSSSDLMAQQILADLAKHDVEGEIVRLVDHDVKPGVEKDMGDGDQWPAIREKLLAADILVFAGPTWLGQMSSVAKRALERLDAELSEQDADGRPILFGKVAVAAVVGNEDGAHHIIAEAYQALSDCGYTIPAQGCTYWSGETMTPGDYNDLDETPETVTSTIATLSRNAVHLARALQRENYPVG